MSALGTVIAATVAIHVTESDIPLERMARILDALVTELRASGREPVVDSDAAPCAPPIPCAEGIRARTGALDVVLLRLIDGPRRTRVLATRVHTGGVAQTWVEVPADGGDLAALGEIVSGVFLSEPARASRGSPGTTPQTGALAPPSRPSLLPAIAAAVALAASGAAMYFALDRRHAFASVGQGIVPEARWAELDRRATLGSVGAVASLVVAVAAATTALLLVIEEPAGGS
ncbi:MAG: hypothetical protein IT384_25000 [Deltaproteobacteria bacterium]|nr:hypothetical protein [Deltaproteobacteria bacterium]